MTSQIIEIFHPSYPRCLRDLSTPPCVIRVRGALPTVPGVAIVGTRTPSAAGEHYAFELAQHLSSAGVAVWSGGATGIDRAAHRGAIAGGGPTVLVAPCGLDAASDASGRDMAPLIEQNGARISLVDDLMLPKTWMYFARNGVLAAMTVAVVIVECRLRSGARNTSSQARKLGRQVWVVPHAPWMPWGPAVAEEVRVGARSLFDVRDLLLAVKGRTWAATQADPPTTKFVRSPNQIELFASAPLSQQVVGALGQTQGWVCLDELVVRTSAAVEDVSAQLCELEILGRVQRDGGRFKLVR